jgi:hypothetical protein
MANEARRDLRGALHCVPSGERWRVLREEIEARPVLVKRKRVNEERQQGPRRRRESRDKNQWNPSAARKPKRRMAARWDFWERQP